VLFKGARTTALLGFTVDIERDKLEGWRDQDDGVKKGEKKRWGRRKERVIVDYYTSLHRSQLLY